MNTQEIVAFALVGSAVVYLLVRYLRRRASGNCCGQPDCPAARQVVDELERRTRSSR